MYKASWIACLCTCFAWTVQAQRKSGSELCASMYSNGYYLPASKCYQKEGDAIRMHPQIPERLRIQKGIFYREAARNLELAARKEKRPAVAAYLRERAVSFLERILKQGLVRKKFGKRRGRFIRITAQKYRAKVGYASLAISTSQLQSTIQLKGYRFLHTTKGRFNKRLRPGMYTITVRFPKSAKVRVRKITLLPNTPKVVSFLHDPPLPVLASTGYIIGAVAAVGGGVMLAYGMYFLFEGRNCYASGQCKIVRVLRTSDEYMTCWANSGCKGGAIGSGSNQAGLKSFEDKGTTWAVTGGIVALVGATMLTVAIIMHMNSRRKDNIKRQRVNAVAGHPESEYPYASTWSMTFD